jgi:hypothetical protein
MFRAGVLLLLVALPSTALADIYMWRDDHGVKHYTNSRSLVPVDATAAVVLEEPVVTRQEAPPPREPAPEPPRQAQVVYDQSALADAYAEGWQRAMASAQQAQGGAPVTVQINGPLVAAGGASTVDGGYGYPGPSWLDYNYPALVTTSFDRGRSRHLTLRMLMQDQFAIDREGPYLIVDRFPPMGPNLTTIMPNGLPWFVRPGSGLVNRVLTH